MMQHSTCEWAILAMNHCARTFGGTCAFDALLLVLNVILNGLVEQLHLNETDMLQAPVVMNT